MGGWLVVGGGGGGGNCRMELKEMRNEKANLWEVF